MGFEMKLAIFACLLLVAWPVRAQPEEGDEDAKGVPFEWRQGEEFHRQLRTRVGVTWKNGTLLRPCLEKLSKSQRLAAFIDRHVDPGQPLELELAQVTVEEAFGRIAADRGLGFCYYGPIVYFGPSPVAERLRTVATIAREKVFKAPKDQAALWRKSRPLAWADFATPRDLLSTLAQEAGLTLANPEAIPHDLWAAADLPPMSLADRVSLVASQFDWTFVVDSRRKILSFEPIPDDPRISRTYPGGSKPEEKAEAWRNLAPSAEIEVEGKSIVARGRIEDHERFAPSKPTGAAKNGKSPKKVPAPSKETKTYTLGVKKQPVRAILNEIKKQDGLRFDCEEAALAEAGLSLDTKVTFDVAGVTLEELLKATLEPAGLTFRKNGDRYGIVPKSK